MSDKMSVKIQSFEDLFDTALHCIVPNFQRPYVWDKEKQWELLWDDIRQTATEYLDHLERNHSNKTLAAELTHQHFLGAIILQQQQTPIGQPKQVLVIDGQQRLTTVQLLLHAASDIYDSSGLRQYSEPIEGLVNNRRASGPSQYKLWPSSNDRASFQAVMKSDDRDGECQDSLIAECHHYFKREFNNWISGDTPGYTSDAKAEALFVSLYGLLTFAVIELSGRDDPYVMFETLNARGTPLTPGDLVQNYILQAGERDLKELSHDELYERLWAPLEAKFWRKKVRTGALQRSRLDVFLQYWLVSVVLQDVKHERVFSAFKRHADEQNVRGRSVEDIAKQIQHAAATYRSWSWNAADSRRGVFFRRGWTCGLGGMSPLLLYVDTQPDHLLCEAQKLEIFSYIESYLVRRALSRARTAGLNRASLDAMQRLKQEQTTHWPDALRLHFAGLLGPLRWPDDAELKDSLLDRPISGRIGRGHLRMVLSAIEEHHRSALAFDPDTYIDPARLTIEHIMPQKWHKHWPIIDSQQESIEQRDEMVDTLGNLTLVNSGLNSSISNGPWIGKRDAIGQHSSLFMNKDICNYEIWDEAAIRRRGEALLEQIIEIWPRPRGST